MAGITPLSLLKSVQDGQPFSPDRFNLDQGAIEDAVNTLISNLESVTDSVSGADYVKATGITGITPTGGSSGADGSIQQILEGLKAAIDGVSQGAIPDGSISAVKLDFDVYTQAEVDTLLDSANLVINGAAETIITDNLTASRALVSDANGKVAVHDNGLTSTELGYLKGVTAYVQTQINTKLTQDANGRAPDAAMLLGYIASLVFLSSNGAFIPIVKTDGGLEVGNYIDFHKVGSVADYDARIGIDASGNITITSGTVTLTGNLVMTDAKNIAVGTTTGTKIGTATTQKLGFWNVAPVVQPSAWTTTWTGTEKTLRNLNTPDPVPIDAVPTFSSYGGVATYLATERTQVLEGFDDVRTDLANIKNNIRSMYNDLKSIGLLS